MEEGSNWKLPPVRGSELEMRTPPAHPLIVRPARPELHDATRTNLVQRNRDGAEAEKFPGSIKAALSGAV